MRSKETTQQSTTPRTPPNLPSIAILKQYRRTLAQFDELAAEVMTKWRIPGLAMAVIRGKESPLLRC